MRYALRNKKKIEKAFGNGAITNIIKDLDSFFTSNDDVSSYVSVIDNEKYPVLNILESSKNSRFVLFYVLKTKYDVYNLALKANK